MLTFTCVTITTLLTYMLGGKRNRRQQSERGNLRGHQWWEQGRKWARQQQEESPFYNMYYNKN